MIVQCPSCSAQFHVPPEAVPREGRKLRCSSCAHVWHFAHPDDLFEEETPEFIESQKPHHAAEAIPEGAASDQPFAQVLQQEMAKPTAVPPLPQPAYDSGGVRKPFWRLDRDGVRGYAAAVLAACVVSVIVSFFIPVPQAVPSAEVPAVTFNLVNVRRVADGAALRVEAVLTNESKAMQAVLPVRVRLMGVEDTDVLGSWVMQPRVMQLPPGESTTFEVERQFDRAAKVSRVDLSFVVGKKPSH